MTEHHTDELNTASMGAAADLVYLMDAARQHLEATEDLAVARANLESPDLAELVTATGLAAEQASGHHQRQAQIEYTAAKEEVIRLRSLVTSFTIQANALRELHRKTLDDFIDSRPGPAERRAQELLKSLQGTKERREQQATRRQTGR